MPKRPAEDIPEEEVERKEEEVEDEGVPAKKMKKNSDGSVYFELTPQRRVTVKEFKKKMYVDIREYYEKDGEKLPGKKGISLNAEQWEALLEIVPAIQIILGKN